jgi:hypothetical protein
MVQIQNDVMIAAVNELIEGVSMRLRGLDLKSIEWQRFNAELEAYGRVMDVLQGLSEKQPAGVPARHPFVPILRG